MKREEGWSDKLDSLKFISDVHLRIKEDIKADFIFAKLGEADKDGIINMTVNAYSSKRLMYIYASKIKNANDQETIKKIGDAIFDNFMTKVYMIVTLNRNIDGNYIIDVLSNAGRETEEIAPEGAVAKGKELLKNEEK